MKHGANTKFQILMREKSALNDTVFGRVFQENWIVSPGDPEKARKLLSKLADSMQETQDKGSDVGAGLTFFGQFIDHDITLDTTSALGRAINVASVRNIRTPALDLDCIFGNGSESSNYLYSAKHPGYMLFGTKDNAHDLPRNCDGRAMIGDHRNDENLIVSQLQGLFIQFYNLVLHRLETAGSKESAAYAHLGDNPEKAAMQVVRWYYQWLVVNEFLPAFIDKKVLTHVLWHLKKGRFPKPFTRDSPIIPIEFAVACYRFGHATVQNVYELSKGHKIDLFQNDGKPGLPGFGPKYKADNIDFAYFFDGPDGAAHQTARPIGTKLGTELFELPDSIAMPKEVEGDNGLVIPGKEVISLAHRNIYRDRFSFGLASGQQVAGALGLTPIDRNEATKMAGLDKIPLWYYCLQEAEERHEGKLGETGGTIVATVILRLLVEDPTSIWYNPDFSPKFFGAEKGKFSIGHMAKWVGDTREEIGFWKDLCCPR